MYGFSIKSQGYALFMFLGIGFALGVLYDAVRIIRLSLSEKKVALYISDAVYVILFALVTFCAVLVVNWGEMHFYMFLSEFLGFFIYYFTFDAFVRKFSETVIKLLKKIYRTLFKIFSAPVRLSVNILISIAKILKNPLKKIQKNLKIVLQKFKGLVYNKFTKLGFFKNGKRASSDEDK